MESLLATIPAIANDRTEKQLKALCTPNTLKIIRALMSGKRYCVTELCAADVTGLGQSAVSMALAKLSDNELVSCQKEGKQHFYTVNRPLVLSLVAMVADIVK